ncbi:membrane protein [Lachnospiraceae bacterium KM106-2]|nr:membrane protein [Lachnospiraceae bacterium KM106-2]
MKFIKDIIKGVMMGVANIIPGVSGGTMAVSMGIYDDIISSITNLFSQFKKSIKTLLPYIIGMGLGLVGLSFIIKFLLANYSLPTNFAFIGLILGGLPILFGRLKGSKINIAHGIVFLLFFALIIGLQLLGGGDETGVVIKLTALEVVKLFFIGVIASATMVIPGVSGSMILMILGYYSPIIDYVTKFIKALAAFDMTQMLDCAAILVPFGIGVVIGIFAIAKLIEFLLNRYESLTYSAILGLVIASPFAILMSAGIAGLTVGTIVVSAITFAIGFAVAYVLGRE